MTIELRCEASAPVNEAINEKQFVRWTFLRPVPSHVRAPDERRYGQSKGRFQEGHSDGDHTEEGEREKLSDSHQ